MGEIVRAERRAGEAGGESERAGMRGQHSILYMVTKTDNLFPKIDLLLLRCFGNANANDFFAFLHFA